MKDYINCVAMFIFDAAALNIIHYNSYWNELRVFNCFS